jgi:hypothetical protein
MLGKVLEEAFEVLTIAAAGVCSQYQWGDYKTSHVWRVSKRVDKAIEAHEVFVLVDGLEDLQKNYLFAKFFRGRKDGDRAAVLADFMKVAPKFHPSPALSHAVVARLCDEGLPTQEVMRALAARMGTSHASVARATKKAEAILAEIEKKAFAALTDRFERRYGELV